MSPAQTVRPSGSDTLDTDLEKTEEGGDEEDLRRLFRSLPSSSSSSPSTPGGGLEGEDEQGGGTEEGGSPGGGSKVSVELHSEGGGESEEEGGGSIACPSPISSKWCAPPSSGGQTSCISTATLTTQREGGIGDGAWSCVGAGVSAGLGGDEQGLCLVGGQGASSVRYLWGLRRILGGSAVWGLPVPLRCCSRRVKWTFWLWFCRAAARVMALGWSWFWTWFWPLGRGWAGCELRVRFLRTCRALERSAEPLARTFLEFSFRRRDPDEDGDGAADLRREGDGDDDVTRIPDDDGRRSARPPLSSPLKRLSSNDSGTSAGLRLRDASSPRRSTGPRRASRCPPDVTTPLHLSQSTWRGRSLMAFMMDVGSSQRYRLFGLLIFRGGGWGKVWL